MKKATGKKGKYDASESGDKVKDEAWEKNNRVKYYLLGVNFLKEGGDPVKVFDIAQSKDEKTKIKEEYFPLIEEIFRIEGVSYIWVYPDAIYIHKHVAADWKSVDGLGVHEFVVKLLVGKGLASSFKAIKDCDFPPTV